MSSGNNYERARLILDGDFISPEEISQARGVNYGDEQLKMFADTLPSEADTIWLRDNGYMLVTGPPNPMSLLDIRATRPEYLHRKSAGWYAGCDHGFSRDDKALTAWLGLRKGSVPDSTSKNWDEQKNLVSDVERVPNVAEVTWGVTTYKAVRGVYLLKGIYVRTSSVSSGDYRISFGFFGPDGLNICEDLGGISGAGFGLASARIFNPS